MKQLRYLHTCILCSRERIKQANGDIVGQYPDIREYLIQAQEIADETSASIYGADINKMLRISSPRSELEDVLLEKINFTSDNVTNYCIKFGRFVYEIKSVKKNWIDLKILCEISAN